jgi:isopentenyl-diphosphate delta-isomerase
MCPVLVAWVDSDAPLRPDPDQVAQTSWVPWRDVVDGVDSGTRPLSPWSDDQVRALSALGPDPDAWPPGDPALLPAAARAGQAGPEGWLGA